MTTYQAFYDLAFLAVAFFIFHLFTRTPVCWACGGIGEHRDGCPEDS
jgi:hypothetical protein